MKNIKNIVGAFLISTFALAQSTDQNFVKTTTYRGEGATLPQTQVTYYDGLGRPIQKVANAQSNTGKDIVTHIEYDAYGRQVKDYLPHPTTQNTMSFIDPMVAQSNTLNYYQGQFNDATAFSEKQFEASPLDRVFKQAAPGDAWAMGSGHEIKFDYQTNVATGNEAVNLYQVTTSWDTSKLVYTTGITQNGSYAANQLYVTITKDENWTSGKNHTTEEFKDKEGRVVLKRTYTDIIDPVTNTVTETQAQHNTYYIYDVYGNLAYVLPPLAEGAITQTVLDGLCYQYQYDHRNRLVAKKLPGKQWEFIVYDNLDRPVATGPALSPWGDETWGSLITEYDVFGRVTKTGWKNLVLDETSRASYQNSLTSLALTDENTLTKNYYDNYTYPNAPTVPTSLPNSQYPIAQNVKGLATGTWVRILDNASTQNGELNYTFYDNKYRPVHTFSQNYLGGYTQVDSNIDFSGKTIYTITTHKRTATDTDLIVRDDFTYSAQDRLTLHTQTMNGVTQTIVANTYDELGQLINKKVGGDGTTPLQKVDYSYNIRGWLKGINDITDLKVVAEDPMDLFAFKINYNDYQAVDVNDVAPQPLFNGNISATYWKTANDAETTRKYNYGYDSLNRLLEANSIKPNSAAYTNSFKEHLQYDKNGNILSLKRNGVYEDDSYEYEIDNLVYNYDTNNKNQLKEVEDTTGWTEGFKDEKPSDSIDYTYDENGNMKSDFNKNITSITYNHLNLPVKIIFNGNELTKIEYLYDATGRKIEKKVSLMKRVRITCGSGGGSSSKATVSNAVRVCYTYVPGTDTTNYLQGGFQYKNNMMEFFPHAEGYVQYQEGSGFYYVYNMTDHLGNVRVSYQDAGGYASINEESNYYAFGLKHKGYNDLGNTIYKYKYNGKELQDELGLNMYDYGARNYDPALGRWMNIDPLAENSRRWTPYNYAYNNPMFFIDPDGMQADGWITQMVDGKKSITYNSTVNTVEEAKAAGYEGATAVNTALNVSSTDGSYSYNLNENGSVTDADGNRVDATSGISITTEAGTKISSWGLQPLPPSGSGAATQMDFSSPFFALGAVLKPFLSPLLGKAASVLGLADDAIVVRGGTCLSCQFENGSGVTMTNGVLDGVSVNSANGASIQTLSGTIRNGQVGTTTVGEVRALGGQVMPSPTPNNPFHSTLSGITPQQAEALFAPTIKNPKL